MLVLKYLLKAIVSIQPIKFTDMRKHLKYPKYLSYSIYIGVTIHNKKLRLIREALNFLLTYLSTKDIIQIAFNLIITVLNRFLIMRWPKLCLNEHNRHQRE